MEDGRWGLALRLLSGPTYRGGMADDGKLTLLFAELDSVANAPMTAAQRQARATPLMEVAGVSLAEAVEGLSREGLPWNGKKAAEYGISLEKWREAMQVAGIPAAGSLDELLDRIHRAESAAQMLKAGYKPSIDASGELAWKRG